MNASEPSTDWIRNLYVMHLGGEADNELREDSLARGVLSVTWDVPVELIRRKDWLSIQRHLKAVDARRKLTRKTG